MRKDEVIDRLWEALQDVESIDLRGRHQGTPIHRAVVTVRSALTDAIDALEEEK